MNADDDTAPLCFVLMPFGTKSDLASGLTIDFDAVYGDVIRPAILEAGLKPVRADEERVGGFIHKPMYERLILCEYAVADLTTANANVYYELGIRHAMRPWTTVLTYADGTRLPFDVGPMRALRYHVDTAGAVTDAAGDRNAIADQLRAARDETTDSPLFQLLSDLPAPDLSRLKADVFRERVEYSSSIQQELAEARRDGLDAVRTVAERLGDLHDQEAAVIVDLMLSFRHVNGWEDVVTLVDAMPPALARTTLVLEQYAMALNRVDRGEEAEQILVKLIGERGPSSETYGLLGRVYKDRWDTAKAAGKSIEARGQLDKAINAYVKGFESDWRDAYPGINAVQLMELRHPPDPRRHELLPVVTYSVKRRVESTQPDYWDYATLLELAMLGRDEEAAMDVLPAVVTAEAEGFARQSTRDTLQRLREARHNNGETIPAWMIEVEGALDQATP